MGGGEILFEILALLQKKYQNAVELGFARYAPVAKGETRVDLTEPVPVHIVYRTAFTSVTGELNFRRDVYSRDSRIWNALAAEGVAVRAIGG